MTEYKALRDLLKYLKIKHMPTKYWSDNFGWELAKHIYLVVLDKLKDNMRFVHFIAIFCDEVTSCDSRQRFSFHVHVVLDWICIPVLLHLSKVKD